MFDNREKGGVTAGAAPFIQWMLSLKGEAGMSVPACISSVCGHTDQGRLMKLHGGLVKDSIYASEESHQQVELEDNETMKTVQQ